MAGNRLDQALVERGLCESREKARRAIMAGQVVVNQQPARKASDRVLPADIIALTSVERYVSRGGLKLEHALQYFQLDVTGQTAVDLGASTGGFTDCLLQHGAARVYAVDVGHGQLAWKLRQDPRVVVMEKMNARDLTPARFQAAIDVLCKKGPHLTLALSPPSEGAEREKRSRFQAALESKSGTPLPSPLPARSSRGEGEAKAGAALTVASTPVSSTPVSSAPVSFSPVDLVVIDCSFISLNRIIPVAIALLRPSGRMVALIKPQFEAGKAEADKGKGVITDPAIHARVLGEIEAFARGRPQLAWRGSTASPLLGPAGNREFFALIEKTGESN